MLALPSAAMVKYVNPMIVNVKNLRYERFIFLPSKARTFSECLEILSPWKRTSYAERSSITSTKRWIQGNQSSPAALSPIDPSFRSYQTPKNVYPITPQNLPSCIKLPILPRSKNGYSARCGNLRRISIVRIMVELK